MKKKDFLLGFGIGVVATVLGGAICQAVRWCRDVDDMYFPERKFDESDSDVDWEKEAWDDDEEEEFVDD